MRYATPSQGLRFDIQGFANKSTIKVQVGSTLLRHACCNINLNIIPVTDCCSPAAGTGFMAPQHRF